MTHVSEFKIPPDYPSYDDIAQSINEGRYSISPFGPTLFVFNTEGIIIYTQNKEYAE